MSGSNGRLSQDVLAPIAGGGYLRKDAAAAWNAMAAHILEVEGVHIAVTGPDSSYRTYDRQVYYRNYWCSRGQCGNAADPGTSNHGWGLAVDVPQFVRDLIDKYGRPFGFAKEWSDAPGEWWHIKWREGVWHGTNPGPGYHVIDKYPTLKRGDTSGAVKRAQKHLVRWNLGLDKPFPDGKFGKSTEEAVRQFQIAHGIKPDGVIGTKTWKVLRTKDKLHPDERGIVNVVRVLQHDGLLGQTYYQHRKWALKRAKKIKKIALRHGWDKDNRRYRFNVMHKIAVGK